MDKFPYSTPQKMFAAAAAAGRSLPPPHQYFHLLTNTDPST